MHTNSSVRKSACPLDCPDACTLDVDVNDGRVVKIGGNHDNPITGGYICRKVRHFTEHMYGPDRLLHPAVRIGPKGTGKFRRIEWEEAYEIITQRLGAIRAEFGGEAILPYCYGGSNGFLSQDAVDARFFRRLGASRIGRTLCAMATTRASRGLYGMMPGVAFPDFAHARLIVLWGVNPTASGIHLAPYIKQARTNGAKLVVVDPVRTPLAASADLYLPVRPGADVALALSVAHWLFENNRADLDFLTKHATGVEEFRRRASKWSIEKAAVATGIDAGLITQFATLYADSSPAVVRSGWGMERNRNGGSAIASVVALPAIAGKFGVRGGGFTMSNTPAWDMAGDGASQEPPATTRLINMVELGKALEELNDPPIQALFVYNANPVASTPHQSRVSAGLAREDLFTIVHEQVMTDTALFADLLLPATTFLEHDELSRGYGSMILNRSEPAADRVGESRPNFEVFGELCKRMGLEKPGDVYRPQELVRLVLQTSANRDALLTAVGEGPGFAPPACGSTPVQFVDVWPKTPSGLIELVPTDLDSEAPSGLYALRPPTMDANRFPLTLVSPASAKTISSTLAQIWKEPAELWIHPTDAADRGIQPGDSIRAFNNLGEVICGVRVTDEVREGVTLLHKGYWRRHTSNGATATALAPDSLTDLGGGACFNDALIQVERAVSPFADASS